MRPSYFLLRQDMIFGGVGLPTVKVLISTLPTPSGLCEIGMAAIHIGMCFHGTPYWTLYCMIIPLKGNTTGICPPPSSTTHSAPPRLAPSPPSSSGRLPRGGFGCVVVEEWVDTIGISILSWGDIDLSNICMLWRFFNV